MSSSRPITSVMIARQIALSLSQGCNDELTGIVHFTDSRIFVYPTEDLLILPFDVFLEKNILPSLYQWMATIPRRALGPGPQWGEYEEFNGVGVCHSTHPHHGNKTTQLLIQLFPREEYRS